MSDLTSAEAALTASESDLATAVKAIGDRVTADIATLKAELAQMGVTMTGALTDATTSIETQAQALAAIDPAAPTPPPTPEPAPAP